MSGEAAIEASEMTEQRENVRRRILWRAKLQCGTHDFDCWVYDLSLGGAKVRFDLPLTPDCAVVLDIPDIGAISGRVSWSVAGQMGIDFILGPNQIAKLFGNRTRFMKLK
jgi:hypothetical protein